ncbi:MAG: primosomal protein N' [Sphaerochaeta sp.]|uniref:replication restart helicase PriA n=1 Tax=Sphaerochaeta sp. TaxID=1972642 RepID=UPI00258E015B|nr:primosomal protein N' [Sphaerochaeta sp.]MDD4037047.1 primosomal protein N' [Sphaerochaeta sp.]
MALFAQVALDLPLKQSFTYTIDPEMAKKVEVGHRVVVPFGKREMTGYVIELLDAFSAAYELKPIKRVIDASPLYGRQTIDLAAWMSRYYLCSLGEALSMMIPGGRRELGIPALEVEEDLSFSRIEQLSDEQDAAVQAILRSEKPMYYLYGVTGSGKSEVFLRCAEAVIAQGKSVIYLVPEITLTHQLAQQVSSRFANKVAILHSALTPSQRLKEWKRIIAGEVNLAIGARSAVFAPFENLGLIILDEEHENSYKSGNTPRYHARQVAQRRCQQEGATLVMGSATPSLEAYSLMQDGTQVGALHLTKRVAGGSMPAVEVVNLALEKSLVSAALKQGIKATLDKKKQVILFLNRRGFSYFFHCNSCGYELHCPHCSVALTYHKKSEQMVCHYCGYRTSPMRVCPECRSVDVTYSGFGTEMVEQEIRTLFPKARVERLDTDSAKEKGHVQKTLSEFRQGSIDILLGTQMVAKGLNFPKVELVGIVLADSGMNIPDFRSQERTFSLLVQVSGRAGRYNDQGKVIIQTFHPDNPAIQYALAGDVEGFYHEELVVRRDTAFPPYSRLINLVLRGRNQKKVEAETHKLEELLNAASAYIPAEVLTSGECPLEMIASNYRFHILVSAKDGSSAHHLVATALASYTPPSAVYLEVDIDPLQLL